MNAEARRPSGAAAPRTHHRAVQTRLIASAPHEVTPPESPPTSRPRAIPAMPVEVMIFRRTDWEGPLAELNELLRALFAIGRAGERELIDMVATHFGLTRAEMVGARGTSGIAQARHIAMYLCRRELGTSASVLGRLFRRDQSSVIHAARKVAARIAENPALAAEVTALAARWRERRT
jgi:hypothetical protein